MYKLVLFIYSIVMNLYITILRAALPFIKSHKLAIKSRLLLNERLKYPDQSHGKLIWIHAASIGEIYSIKSLVDHIHNLHKDYRFIVTTQRATPKFVIDKYFPMYTKHNLLFYDSTWLAAKFLRIYNPSLVLWLEQEIFPNTLHTIKASNIPIIFLNARISKRSYKVWKKFKPIIKKILDYFDFVSVMSKQHLKIFTELTQRKFHFLGNLKHSNISILYDSEEYHRFKKIIGNKTVICALSTHEAEEKLITRIYEKLKIKINNLHLIIIPRHIERVSKLEIANSVLYSNISDSLNNHDITLVDQNGKVDMFCSLAPITFVGKSMSTLHKGGHNIFQPLKCGSCIITGPHIEEILDDMKKCINHNAGFIAKNEEILYEKILTLLNTPQLLQDMRYNTRYMLEGAEKIIANTYKEIQCFLK